MIRFNWFMNGPVVVKYHNFNFLLLILNLYQSSNEMLWQYIELNSPNIAFLDASA